MTSNCSRGMPETGIFEPRTRAIQSLEIQSPEGGALRTGALERGDVPVPAAPAASAAPAAPAALAGVQP